MVSLEIPYYPCLFGQTKSVPGIKYRKLGDGENNYYESFKSVAWKDYFVWVLWHRHYKHQNKHQIFVINQKFEA